MRGCHAPVLDSFAEKLRWLSRLSDTLPPRAVAPELGHSFSLQTWKRSRPNRSTPTVPSFCIQENGRQLACVLPVKRWMSALVMYCMMVPGANEL